MFETLRNTLAEWNQRTSERQKLQHTYVALLAVVIFIAGLVALFNDSNNEQSRHIMFVALALITTFVVNFIVWGLLKSIVLDKLPRNTRTNATRRTTRRR